MHVLQVIATFHLGGLERVVLDLSRALATEGVRTTVAAIREDGVLRSRFEEHGIATRFLDSDPGYGLSLVGRLARLARRERVDLVHAHHFAPLVHAGPAATLTATPLVYTEHSVEAYDAPRRRLVARALLRRARTACVSDVVRDWVRAELRIDATTIVNGVGVPSRGAASERARARAELGILPGDVVFACVARLVPEKDHETLIRAFESITAAVPSALLLVIGGGPLAPALADRVGASPARHRIRLLGQSSEVQRLFAVSDAVVLTSVSEGLPLALLEGMAAGLPAIATAVGAVPELITDATGAVIAPGDVRALAGTLQRYAMDAALRSAQGAAARARVERRYSVRAMARGYRDLYETAAGRIP